MWKRELLKIEISIHYRNLIINYNLIESHNFIFVKKFMISNELVFTITYFL